MAEILWQSEEVAVCPGPQLSVTVPGEEPGPSGPSLSGLVTEDPSECHGSGKVLVRLVRSRARSRLSCTSTTSIKVTRNNKCETKINVCFHLKHYQMSGVGNC